jgi:hypothetical protein
MSDQEVQTMIGQAKEIACTSPENKLEEEQKGQETEI